MYCGDFLHRNCVLILLLLKEERFISHKSEILIVHDLLCTANKKHAFLNQRFVELRIDLILCLISKIDDYITANDQMAA